MRGLVHLFCLALLGGGGAAWYFDISPSDIPGLIAEAKKLVSSTAAAADKPSTGGVDLEPILGDISETPAFANSSESITLGDEELIPFGQEVTEAAPAPLKNPPVRTLPAEPLPGGPVHRTPAISVSDGDASQPAAPVMWRRTFQSTQQRAIETARFGVGGARTVVIGSLHGNEPGAIDLIERLAASLAGPLDGSTEVSAILVKSGNPDGLALGTRTNSRGVDLNRNFPTRDFRSNSENKSGPRAASEVETQAIRRLLVDLRPKRVVHIKTTTSPSGWIIYNRAAQATAQRIAKLVTMHLEPLDNAYLPGSIEKYVDDELKAECITIAVPDTRDTEVLWSQFGETLVTSLDLPETLANANWSAINGQGGIPATPASTTRFPYNGYYELPPSP